ncbi:hypothetical protein [Krasilnikovia cinnamomea]|nr:hypothetical protein [Krasilnikovia cinnamomea]
MPESHAAAEPGTTMPSIVATIAALSRSLGRDPRGLGAPDAAP